MTSNHEGPRHVKQLKQLRQCPFASDEEMRKDLFTDISQSVESEPWNKHGSEGRNLKKIGSKQGGSRKPPAKKPRTGGSANNNDNNISAAVNRTITTSTFIA